MVMPHSALGAGQYAKWRSGRWGAHRVDFGFKRPWDLERLKPNDFFPIPACVAFARRSAKDRAVALAGTVDRWEGRPGDPNVKRTAVPLQAGGGRGSPYRSRASQGATLVPRCLFLVNEETENPARVQALRAGSWSTPTAGEAGQDGLGAISTSLGHYGGRMIESAHVFERHGLARQSSHPTWHLAPVAIRVPDLNGRTSCSKACQRAAPGATAVEVIDVGPARSRLDAGTVARRSAVSGNSQQAGQPIALTLLPNASTTIARALHRQIEWQIGGA